MTELYFAYGSNMSADAMNVRCPSACLRAIVRANTDQREGSERRGLCRLDV
jgi:hypothetical protein